MRLLKPCRQCSRLAARACGQRHACRARMSSSACGCTKRPRATHCPGPAPSAQHLGHAFEPVHCSSTYTWLLQAAAWHPPCPGSRRRHHAAPRRQSTSTGTRCRPPARDPGPPCNARTRACLLGSQPRDFCRGNSGAKVTLYVCRARNEHQQHGQDRQTHLSCPALCSNACPDAKQSEQSCSRRTCTQSLGDLLHGSRQRLAQAVRVKVHCLHEAYTAHSQRTARGTMRGMRCRPPSAAQDRPSPAAR